MEIIKNYYASITSNFGRLEVQMTSFCAYSVGLFYLLAKEYSQDEIEVLHEVDTTPSYVGCKTYSQVESVAALVLLDFLMQTITDQIQSMYDDPE